MRAGTKRCAELHPVAAARFNARIGDHQKRRLRGRRDRRQGSARSDHRAARDIHLLAEGERDRWPATATSRSPVCVTMRATVAMRRAGSTVTASPGRTSPPVIVPAKPRKSEFGRFTHCTGKRKSAPVEAAISPSPAGEQGRPLVPGHVERWGGDIVAIARRKAESPRSRPAESSGERAELGDDGSKTPWA